MICGPSGKALRGKKGAGLGHAGARGGPIAGATGGPIAGAGANAPQVENSQRLLCPPQLVLQPADTPPVLPASVLPVPAPWVIYVGLALITPAVRRLPPEIAAGLPPEIAANAGP